MRVVALAAVLVLTSGAPALAAQAPTEGTVVVFAQDGELIRANADLTDRTIVTPLVDRDDQQVGQLNSSADGSRFVYLLSTAAQGWQLLERDAGGRLVRTLDDARGTDYVPAAPALSPDASRAVWVRSRQFDASLWTAGPSGPATEIPHSEGLGEMVVVDNAPHLLAWDDASRKVLSVDPDGTRHPVGGLPELQAFAVSPDQGTIVWTDYSQAESTWQIFRARLTQVDGSWSAGPATLLVPSVPAYSPLRVSHDNALVYWTTTQFTSSLSSDVYSVPITGGPAQRLTDDPRVMESEVVGATLDTAAPAPAVAQPATLAGTSATVRWDLPGDPDLSGVLIDRVGYGAVPHTVFVPAPATSYRDDGLRPGATYQYTFTTVDRSGNLGTGVRRQLTALAPTATFYDPTSAGSATPPFRVTFLFGVRYTVSYRTNGTGDFVRWATDSRAASLVFGRDGGTVSTPGNSYQFRVQMFDDHGNATLPTVLGTAVVPLDQNAMTFTGHTSSTGAAVAWLTTERVLHDGASARFTATANRLQVIGSRCRTCGVLTVYVDGKVFGTVGTRAPQRQDKVTLLTRPLAPGPHAFLLRASGDVIVDGAGLRR